MCAESGDQKRHSPFGDFLKVKRNSGKWVGLGSVQGISSLLKLCLTCRFFPHSRGCRYTHQRAKTVFKVSGSLCNFQTGNSRGKRICNKLDYTIKPQLYAMFGGHDFQGCTSLTMAKTAIFFTLLNVLTMTVGHVSADSEIQISSPQPPNTLVQ